MQVILHEGPDMPDQLASQGRLATGDTQEDPRR